jgi:hypothetical protein
MPPSQLQVPYKGFSSTETQTIPVIEYTFVSTTTWKVTQSLLHLYATRHPAPPRDNRIYQYECDQEIFVKLAQQSRIFISLVSISTRV